MNVFLKNLSPIRVKIGRRELIILNAKNVKSSLIISLSNEFYKEETHKVTRSIHSVINKYEA